MNKEDFIKELMNRTNRGEIECIVINDILENHFIIGNKNKEKIKNDFIEKLKVSEEEADKIYNTCAELIAKGVFKRK